MTRRLPILLACLLVVAATTACDGTPGDGSDTPGTDTATDASGATADADDPQAGDVPLLAPGLTATGRLNHQGSTRQGPHLSELVVVGDYVYVANAMDFVTAYRLDPDGGLEQTHDARALQGTDFCQFIDVHPASKSLMCAQMIQDGLPLVRRLDLAEPDTPTKAEDPGVDHGGAVTRDLTITSDSVFLAAIDRGVLQADISLSGSLTAFEETAIGGFIVQVDASDQLLAALDSERGVVAASIGTGALAESAVMPLEAPLTDVAVTGVRVAVGMGSLGAAVYDYADGALTESVRVEPPCVVSAVALRSDEQALAVGCLSGVFVYDLRGAAPRVAGFEPSLRVVLDLAWAADDSLVASDWEWLTRWTVDLDGENVRLDRPRGAYVRPGDSATLTFRNPGSATLSGHIAPESNDPDHATAVASFDLAPGEGLTFDVPAAIIEENSVGSWPATFDVWVDQDGGQLAREEHVQRVFIVTRREPPDPTLGPPAIGDTFPPLWLADRAGDKVVHPTAGAASRIVFYGSDCSGMWDELADLTWHARQGLAPADGADTILVTHDHPEVLDSNIHRLQLQSLAVATSGGDYHHLVLEPGDEEPLNVGTFFYSDVFDVTLIPGGAQHPTDYVVTEGGTVQRVDRVYRGQHPL